MMLLLFDVVDDVSSPLLTRTVVEQNAFAASANNVLCASDYDNIGWNVVIKIHCLAPRCKNRSTGGALAYPTEVILDRVL
jgi:hypothetical protein